MGRQGQENQERGLSYKTGPQPAGGDGETVTMRLCLKSLQENKNNGYIRITEEGVGERITEEDPSHFYTLTFRYTCSIAI